MTLHFSVIQHSENSGSMDDSIGSSLGGSLRDQIGGQEGGSIQLTSRQNEILSIIGKNTQIFKRQLAQIF